MEYGLPKTVEIDGNTFAIRYDFRTVLDIFEVLNDPELNDRERAYVVLHLFYIDAEAITDYETACRKCFWFINGGHEEPEGKKPLKLVDWQQDFPYIIAPVNRIVGKEIRDIRYDPETNTGGVHWWTFLAAYQEVGDCLFAQIVRIRDKKAHGKPLDKTDREFYRKNRDMIDFKTHYTEAENEMLKAWV